MQEEVTQKTIALVIKTAKLDASVLKAAMKMYLKPPEAEIRAKCPENAWKNFCEKARW